MPLGYHLWWFCKDEPKLLWMYIISFIWGVPIVSLLMAIEQSIAKSKKNEGFIYRFMEWMKK